MGKSSTTWKKGEGGKPKGALNRTTKQSHELFMMIMNGQVDNIEEALNTIKENDAEKYINALSKLMQYYIPRKSDITSGDEKIQVQLPSITIKKID